VHPGDAYGDRYGKPDTLYNEAPIHNRLLDYTNTQ